MGASTKPFTKIVESSGKEIQGNILIGIEIYCQTSSTNSPVFKIKKSN